MRIVRDESGQSIPMVVVFLVVLIGMLALVVDVGSWFRAQRQLQTTADAAALAGAYGLPDVLAAQSKATNFVTAKAVFQTMLPEAQQPPTCDETATVNTDPAVRLTGRYGFSINVYGVTVTSGTLTSTAVERVG